MPRKPDDGVIRFSAEVSQIKTMADKGIRISLDLPEDETETAMKLMECRRQAVSLKVVILPIKTDRSDV